MRKMKKIAAIILAGAMIMSLSLTAFAASNVSTNGQKVLDKAASIKAGYTLSATQEKAYADAIGQATSYLEKNELSDAQVTSITGAIDTAAAAVKAAAPDGDLTKLSSADLKALASKVSGALQAGAAAAGISVTIGTDGNVVFTAKDTGKQVASTEKTVKATGVATGTAVAVIAALVVVLGGCAFFAKKKNMFA